jgi:hypothetical protein
MLIKLEASMIGKLRRAYAKAMSLLSIQTVIDNRLDDIQLCQGAILAELGRSRQGVKLSDF